MSTDLYSIIVPDATIDEGFELAPRVIEWLVAEGVVSGPAERAFTYPVDDRPFLGLCPDDPAVRYKAGPSLAQFVEQPSYVRNTSEIEIRIERRIHADPVSWPPNVATCSNHHDSPPPEGWIQAAEEWAENGDAQLTCPVCGVPSSITGWSFGRQFGIGALAVTFRDPPGISDALVEGIGRLVKPHRVQMVCEHI